MTSNENVYYVKRISGRKYLRKKWCYLIEWEDYAPEENTWEEESCLMGNTELVEEFERQLIKEFPTNPNLVHTHDRIVLSGAFDPESSISESPEPLMVLPLTSKTNSKTNNKRQATDNHKKGSPRKSSRKTVSPELEYDVPEKLKDNWNIIKCGRSKEEIRRFLSELDNSVILAKDHTHKLIRTSATHSHFEGISPRVEVVNTVDGDPFPTDFVYIDGMIFGEGVSPPDPLFLAQCDCDNKLCSGLCHENETLVYSQDGLIKALPGTPIYECNENCECSETCQNRVVQRGRQVPLQIYKTKAKGWGVKALEDIPKGVFVEEYLGEVIKDTAGDFRGKFYDKAGTTYLFDMDFGDYVQYVIDSFMLGNASHFFNHSCSPNLTVYAVYSDSGDVNFHRLAFFSNRLIKKGEEITIDYEGKNKGDTDIPIPQGSPGKATFRCHCSSPNCRKYIHN
ncbi:hypothetical protein BDA99DRAFT_493713 [Phascolomyces articulosus]|uniref:Histone-lysine N-methyltransferase n=1 Tax=Phascolomyces articulosus TaxID=60185 RepID=A0AAD5KRZ0_9FUNG|nr:hypothetical protein BDA99DRAFT_493713 [Phascolomyces articulosus]